MSVFMSPSDRVAQLYPRAPGSIFVTFNNSLAYGEGILTRLHMGPTYTYDSNSIFSPDFPTNLSHPILISSMRINYPAHAILLDMITLKMISAARGGTG
jgi:hypothetical protein